MNFLNDCNMTETEANSD